MITQEQLPVRRVLTLGIFSSFFGLCMVLEVTQVWISNWACCGSQPGQSLDILWISNCVQCGSEPGLDLESAWISHLNLVQIITCQAGLHRDLYLRLTFGSPCRAGVNLNLDLVQISTCAQHQGHCLDLNLGSWLTQDNGSCGPSCKSGPAQLHKGSRLAQHGSTWSPDAAHRVSDAAHMVSIWFCMGPTCSQMGST